MAEETLERPEDAGTDQASQVKFWLDELEMAEKREQDWHEASEKIIQIYEAAKKDTHQFNILYSNTETLAPAIYNTVPRPAVRRRFPDANPTGLLATKIANRLIEYHLDTNLEGYQGGFHEMVEQTIHEALLTGRGVPWLTIVDGAIQQECVPWNFYAQSYARRQSDVWWVARKHVMTRDELEKNFGSRGKKVKVSSAEDSEEGEDDSENKGSLKTTCVWEIWDKRKRKVHFISPGYKDGHLRLVDDPLSLSGFFPCPQALLWLRKVSSLIPVAPYELYEQQAEELNTVTLRINRIIRVMKVRGAYDSSVDGIDKIFELDDGQLSPVENVAALQGGNGKLDSAIWLMPIEKLVAVLQQLYVQREQIKQVIFEITGLADVIRGASKASETLGAQQIKERWGGLRIRKMQARVQLLVRSIMRQLVELSVKNLPAEQLRAMVQVDAPSARDKAAAVQALNLAQMQGQPPDPKLVQIAQAPTFEEALALLQDDLQRAFKVDIESNSTVDVEATEDLQLMSEFLTATGQFINGVSPLVTQGIMPFGAAQKMLLSMSRRLRFGPEVEEELNMMQPPKPPEDGSKAEMAKLQLEQQKAAGELALRQKEIALDEKRITLEMEKVLLEKERTALEREQVAIETMRLQYEAGRDEQKMSLEKERLQGEWREKAEERRLKESEGQASREAQVQAAGGPKQIAELQEQLKMVGQAIMQLQQALVQTDSGVGELRDMVSKPKARKLDRGPDGKVAAVDGLPVQRDAEGRLLGWG